VTIEQLLEVLSPSNVCDRMKYRNQMSLSNKKPFAKVSTKGLHENFNKKHIKRSKTVGFKSKNYAISENGGFATCVIHKRIKEDLSFWVKTLDKSAVSGEDYEHRNQLVSMKAHEKEREINIKIIDNPE